MKNKSLILFIVYTAAGIMGLFLFSYKINSGLVLMISAFLLLSAAVKFKQWKTEKIEEIKKWEI